MLALLLFTIITTITLSSKCVYNPLYHDTYLLCSIFENTNIDDSIWWFWNLSIPNYCQYNEYYPQLVYWDIFNCSSNGLNITSFNIQDYWWITGTINTSFQWPQLIQSIDIEDIQINTSQWKWSSIQNLSNLRKLDLDDVNVFGEMNNDFWNHTLKKLTNLEILRAANTDFYANFSEIYIENYTFDNILELKFDGNPFYGEMSIDGFIKAFPNIRYLNFKNTEISINLTNGNLDFLTSMNNLEYFLMDNCNLFGQISLSQTVTNRLPYTLKEFDVEHNSLSHHIDWTIFEGLYNLQDLELNDNNFIGKINWNIINTLSKQSLELLDLRNNNFSGYADFSDLAHDDIEIYLDTNIHCDPSIYICQGDGITSSDRAYIQCWGKYDCEQSCRCSDGSIPIYSTRTPTSIPTTEVRIERTLSPSVPPTKTIIISSTMESSNKSVASDTNQINNDPDNDKSEFMGLNDTFWILLLIVGTLMICFVICLLIVILVIYNESGKKIKRLTDQQAIHHKQLSSMTPSLTATIAPTNVSGSSAGLPSSMLAKIDESDGEDPERGIQHRHFYLHSQNNVINGSSQLQIPADIISQMSQQSEMDLSSIAYNDEQYQSPQSGPNLPIEHEEDDEKKPKLTIDNCNSEGKDRSQIGHKSTLYGDDDDIDYNVDDNNMNNDNHIQKQQSLSISASSEDMYNNKRNRKPTMTPSIPPNSDNES